MKIMPRRVLPELLDDLRSEDPRARRSRRDLHRIHRAMASVSILRHAIADLGLTGPPRSVIEIGAGDGTLLLRLALALKPRWTKVRLTLLDRQDLLASQTREAYARLGWTVSVRCADALEWAREPATERFDLCITTLFLHHFDAGELDGLLAAVAQRSDAFVACEPRRDLLGRLGSLCVALIGANEVTRKDAVTSVAAGFRGQELSDHWKRVTGTWGVNERHALPFTHVFSAVRTRPRAGTGHGR